MKYGLLNSLQCLINKTFIIRILVILCLPTEEIFSHGSHKDQPVGIIDPLITHHAILEDELKLNYFNVRNKDENLIANTGSLEIAFAFTDFVGFEVFFPFDFMDIDGEQSSGFGDIETFIPKISFIRKYGFVMTTYVAVRIPVGDENADLGKPGWGFAPHMLMDYGNGNFGLQANAAVEIETKEDNAIEGNLSISYSFVLKENSDNKFIVSPLLEFAVERGLNVPEAKSALNIIPGVKIALNGWHLGLGVELPVTDEKEFDYKAMVQLGYHVTWEKVFK